MPVFEKKERTESSWRDKIPFFRKVVKTDSTENKHEPDKENAIGV